MALNPKRKRRNKAARRRPTHARKSASHQARTGAGLAKRHRRRSGNPHHRRRPTHAVAHHRRRRSGNPAFMGGNFGSFLFETGFLIGGGIGSKSLPQIFATTYNTGWAGYLMNLASAFGLSWLAGKWKGAAAARATLLGGIAFTVARVIDDYAGIQLVQFSQISPGQTPLLSGDVRTGMMLAGTFGTLDFVLPTSTPLAAARRRAIAAPPVATAAAPAKKMAGGYGDEGGYS